MPLLEDFHALPQGGPACKALHAAMHDFCAQFGEDHREQARRHRARGKPGSPKFTWNNRGEITTRFFKLMDTFKQFYCELPRPKRQGLDLRGAFGVLVPLLLHQAGVPGASFDGKKFEIKVKDWEHGGTRYSASSGHTVKNVVVTPDYSLMVGDTVLDETQRRATQKKEHDEAELREQEESRRRSVLERRRHTDIKLLREKEQLRREKQISLGKMEERLRAMVGDKEGGLLHPRDDTGAFLDMFEQERADEAFKVSLLNCLRESTVEVRQEFESRGLLRQLRFWARKCRHSAAPAEVRLLHAILKAFVAIPLSAGSVGTFNWAQFLGPLASAHPSPGVRTGAAAALQHAKAAQGPDAAGPEGSDGGAGSDSDSAFSVSSDTSTSASSSSSSSASTSSLSSTAAGPPPAPVAKTLARRPVAAPKQRKPGPTAAVKRPASPPIPATQGAPGSKGAETKWFDLQAHAPTASSLPARKKKRVNFSDVQVVHVLPDPDAEDVSDGGAPPAPPSAPAPPSPPAQSYSTAVGWQPLPPAPEAPPPPLPGPEPKRGLTAPALASLLARIQAANAPPAPPASPPRPPSPTVAPALQALYGRLRMEWRPGPDPAGAAAVQRALDEAAAPAPEPPSETESPSSSERPGPPPLTRALCRQLRLEWRGEADPGGAELVRLAVEQAQEPEAEEEGHQCETQEEYEAKLAEYQVQLQQYQQDLAQWALQGGALEPLPPGREG